MITFPFSASDNPRSTFPTLKASPDNNYLSPPKHPHYLTPLNASLDNSISDIEEEDNKAQNNALSPLKRSTESPIANLEDPSPQKHDVYTEDFPPANPLTTVKYSMEADMLFGWKPKVAVKAPIPLKFSNPMLEEIVTSLYYEKKTEQYPEIIYQGFRPDNTYLLHQKFASSSTYLSKVHPALLVKYGALRGAVNVKRPFAGMREGIRDDCLVFDSEFEHGNLDTVIMKNEDEYDLFLRVDSNTRGHTNWYYFKTRNMKKGQTVKFNIMNLAKHDSLYQRGMKPYVFSERLYEEKGIKWEQNGENILFKLANISYLGQNYEENTRKKFYKVSFEYTFPYDYDTVSFALCIPYTYTQLIQYIQTVMDTQKPSEHGEYIKESKFCNSLGGIDVPLLTITDPDESEIPLSKRQYIVCSGRVHPGEPNSSWMMQGFLDELLKPTEEMKYLTKRFIFKIIPMLNPDGVILGNHRTGFCGNDLNRQYINPKDFLHTTVIALRDLIRDLTQEKKDAVFAYFDFHGHSIMKNVFMYGPEFPIHSYNYYKVKVLPKLISKRTPMFRYQSCTYTIPRGKLSTARAVFSMQYGVVHCYTLEASYSSYFNEKESTPFNEESFMKMGAALLETVGEYKKMLEEEEAVALAFRTRHEIPNADASELDATFDESTNEFGEGDRKKNRFRLKKVKGRKAGGIKKGDGMMGDGTENKGNRFMSTIKERRSKTEPVVFSEMSNMNTGIFKIFEEIKEDALKKEDEEPGSCDKVSEGESDNGDPEDDLEEEEMKQLQENIISNLAELSKVYKPEKIEYKPISRARSKKSKKPEEKLKPLKKLLNQTVEKEIIEPPIERSPPRQNQSPPRSALGPAKQVQRAQNWITRVKQKVPLIPREVQMIVDKPSDSFEVIEQSSLHVSTGPFVATKNGFRRYLMSSHGQKRKPIDTFDQSRKNSELVSQYLRSSVADPTQSIKKPLESKTPNPEQSMFRPLSGLLLKSRTCLMPDDAVKIMSMEPEFKPQATQGSLKALLVGSKCRSRPRLEKRDAYSVDQKDLRDSYENITSTHFFYDKELVDKEIDKSMDASPEAAKGVNGSAIPRLTIIQAQMRSDTVTSVALSLKKEKKLPISYVAYKNNIQLKKKIRDRKLEAGKAV